MLALALGIILVLLSALPLPFASAKVLSTDQIDGVAWSKFGVARSVMPDLDMAAGFLVSGDGRVLWSRGADSERAMASITKVMTAIVAIEHSEPDDVVVVPSISSQAGESSADLVAGEHLSRHRLLEALLVKSGNDAALSLAKVVSGDVERFVAMMNAKAADLGLEHTHFTNPHGLDEAGHYTSAKDIATMVRYAMTLPEFAEVVKEKTVKFRTDIHTHTWQNTNILLFSYRGCNGVKTGHTDKAGFCVVDSAKRGEREVFAVVLGAQTDLSRFFEARDLMDFAFAHYRSQELAVGGTIIGKAKVTNFLDKNVPVAVSKDTSAVAFDLAGTIEQTADIQTTKAPVKKGQSLGSLTFTQKGKLLAKVPLVATENIDKPFFIVQWYYNFVKTWHKIFG